MEIVIIHGQSHKGSTYHIAHMLAEKISRDIKEFFFPKDFGENCGGQYYGQLMIKQQGYIYKGNIKNNITPEVNLITKIKKFQISIDKIKVII